MLSMEKRFYFQRMLNGRGDWKMEQFIYSKLLITYILPWTANQLNNFYIYEPKNKIVKIVKIVQSELLFLDLFSNFSSHDIGTIKKTLLGSMIKGKLAISFFINSYFCYGCCELIAKFFFHFSIYFDGNMKIWNFFALITFLHLINA